MPVSKHLTYKPQGVCSQQIDVDVDTQSGKIQKVIFTGGCSGNTQGVARLLEGMSATEAIERLRGIDCKGKGTSCPDQLAKALAALEKE